MTDLQPDTSAADPLVSIATDTSGEGVPTIPPPATDASAQNGEQVLTAAAETLAGQPVVDDVQQLQDDVQKIAETGQVDAPEVQAHVEQFIADGRARVDLVLEPLKRIDHPSAGVIAGAISDAFHAMIRHFAQA